MSKPVVAIPFAVLACATLAYGQCSAEPNTAMPVGSAHFNVASVRLADGPSLIRRRTPAGSTTRG